MTKNSIKKVNDEYTFLLTDDRDGDPDPTDNRQIIDLYMKKIISYLISKDDPPKTFRPLLANGEGRNVLLIPDANPLKVAIVDGTAVTIIDTDEFGIILSAYNNTAGDLTFTITDGAADIYGHTVSANDYQEAEHFGNVFGTLLRGVVQGKWSAAAAGSYCWVQKFTLTNKENS